MIRQAFLVLICLATNPAPAQVRDDAQPELLTLDREVEMALSAAPDIAFRRGDMRALDLPEASLAGIAAFYAIVHTAPAGLPEVFSELHRVLQPNGLLLLASHIGHETVHRDELWGVRLSLDFIFFPVEAVTQALRSANFEIEEVIEREPYPDVEYQSQRAYVFARRTKHGLYRTSRGRYTT